MSYGDEHEGNPGDLVVVRPQRRPVKEKDRKRLPRYHVLLWDSDFHTFFYVETMLRTLFGHPPEACHQMALQIDGKGRAIVLTTTLEHAELKRDQILAFGADERMTDCAGSMHATIEQADG